MKRAGFVDHYLMGGALALLALALAQPATRAASGNWNVNSSSSWGTAGNWSPAVVPGTANGDVVGLTYDITAARTVTINTTSRTVGLLNIGDSGLTFSAYTLAASGGAHLTFNNNGSTAILVQATTTAADVISAPLVLADNLSISNSSTLTLSGIISESAAGKSITKSGSGYLQLNKANTYSGGTIITGLPYISVANDRALGSGTVLVGASPGAGQVWFQAGGARTLTNAFEIRTIRWIIDWNTVNGVVAGDLTINGPILLNAGALNVRDIYCGMNLTLNGNITVNPASNPFNKQGGSTLTLNGTNTFSGPTTLSAGTMVVNGALNSTGLVTINSGTTLSGTGVIGGTVSNLDGGILSPGKIGAGSLTVGGLVQTTNAVLSFGLGATNNTTNAFLRVNGNLTLAGLLKITDLGGFSSGTYTGMWYSGTLTNRGLVPIGTPLGRTVLVKTNTPHYVLFRVLEGYLTPASGQSVPMDMASPMTLSWVQGETADAYDLYLGTTLSSVTTATTNTAGIYQGRTMALTSPVGTLLPNKTYYWRVDYVAVDGTVTAGTVLSFTTGSPMLDLLEDTWVATDALQRSLPVNRDCGDVRTNRPIGLFYFLWHDYPVYGSGTNWDVSQWISEHPFSDPHNPWADNPIFQTAKSTYWWGQPELGYYLPTDPWMLRRQIALLSHAGVDVLIMDNSNGVTYDTAIAALCDMIRQMRFEGYKINLKIAFLTHAGSAASATYLYNTFYAQNRYSEFWFYWQGKPLMLGYVNGLDASDPPPLPVVQNFFTWRTSWADVATSALQNEWQWIDSVTPQNWGYDSRSDIPEQVAVSSGGWSHLNLGHSYTNHTQPAYDNYHLPVARTQGQGLFFAEEMFYGLKYDPQFLFITGWNEWIAGSFAANPAGSVSMLGNPCPLNGYYFVDEYNEEYSRDIEPMKGGHSDNYYFQMVGQNRQRKGARPVPGAGTPQTINLAGNFSEWTNVTPAYYDVVGDTAQRNYASAIPQNPINYTNLNGRNDFTMLKVARDATNLYFLAKCNANISSYQGSNWMVLFIDADQNHATGWEGYDYAVNLGGMTATTTTLYRNTTTTNGWTWTLVRSDVPYKVLTNQLTVALTRADLGFGSDPLAFDFHWADNFQTNDIAEFGVNGDSAPDRRFNYRYQTVPEQPLGLLADDFESGQQSWWAESWNSGSRWALTTATSYSSNHCAVCNPGNGAGQSALIARADASPQASLRVSFRYKLHSVTNAQNAYVQYYCPTGWVNIRNLGRDQYYATGQKWSYDERQDVWMLFTDTRLNTGADSRFFTTNFAFRIDGSGLTTASQSIWVDDFALTGTALLTSPYFVTQPSSQTVTNGTSVTFSASAAGQSPFGYQWLFDGTNLPAGGNISGVTSNVLSVTAATTNNSGNYSLVVSSGYGSVTSSVASLTVGLPPMLSSSSLTNSTVQCGSNLLTFAVVATGTPPLRLQWSLDGAPVAGATNNSFWLTNLPMTNHTVTVTVTNFYASVSSNAVVTVLDTLAPLITLIGGNPLYDELGSPFTDPGATALDDCSGVVNVSTHGTVDPNTVGVYAIEYVASDVAGNSATNIRQVYVVNTTPLITGIAALHDGSVVLSLGGAPGYAYVLETTTNLGSFTAWQPAITNTPGTNGVWQFSETQATNFQQRFYRLKRAP